MQDGSILKQLVTVAGQDGSGDKDPTPLNFGVYYKNTLVALCHALEDCILATDLPEKADPLVISAFQQGKWYLQEAERYGEIADQARQVVIMAAGDTGFHQHPTSQRENVALVDLDPADPVAQEWHLVILSPRYTAMVLCQELSTADYGPQGCPTHDLERKFYGLWTFDPALVRQTVDCAIAHIGRYDTDLQHRLETQRDAILAENPHLSEVASSQAVGIAVERVLDYLQDCEMQIHEDLTFVLPDALSQNLASNELQAFFRMAQLVDLMDPVNPKAALEVTALLEMMGQIIDLPAWRLKRLQLAGWLHRIAPFQPEALPAAAPPASPLVPGAQVLRRMPQLRAVAQIITHQMERWDGQGQPAGLAGDQIPLESRLLGLVSYFQAQVMSMQEKEGEGAISTAIAACQADQGSRWDPKLVDILTLVAQGLQQGLSLPTLPLKFSLGTGLLNPELDPDLSQLSVKAEGGVM